MGTDTYLELLYGPPGDTVGEEIDTHYTRKRKLGVNTLLSAGVVGMLNFPISKTHPSAWVKKWKLKTGINNSTFNFDFLSWGCTLRTALALDLMRWRTYR